MTFSVHHETKRFERITIYVDLASEKELLPTIAECAAPLAPECVLRTQKDFLLRPTVDASETPNTLPSAACRTAATIGLLQLWQAEEADVYTRYVNNTVTFMNEAELLITDKNTTDGAVTYALYRRQMPVLSLAPAHLPVRSSLQQLLYSAAAGASLEAHKTAIQQFLTFPAERGVYTTASPAAAETTEGRSDLKVTADADTDVATESAAVVVNVDGYPVQLPLHHAAPTSSAQETGSQPPPPPLLPPPPTLFASVLHDLYHASNAHLEVLRRRNPLLPGVLEAFHRYQNRGVMRAMLHRGYRVEVSAQTASAAALQWVEKFVLLSASSEEDVATRMAEAEKTLAKFESHWLELPLAQKGV